jgi:hypothetical protein
MRLYKKGTFRPAAKIYQLRAKFGDFIAGYCQNVIVMAIRFRRVVDNVEGLRNTWQS